MPSTTYLETDGVRLVFGDYENYPNAVIFRDASDTAVHIATPAGDNFAFDIGTTEILRVSATQLLYGCTATPTACAELAVVSTEAGATAIISAFHHNSASPANDDEQQMRFYADDSAGTATELARITVSQEDVTSTTDDAAIRLDVMVANVLLNDVVIIGSLDCAGQAVFVLNEDGDDLDFRVEGDNNANLLLTCGATDNIGFGTAVNAGAFISVEPGAQARDLVTSVGMAVHVEADAWSVNAAGNCETVAVGGLVFLGQPTWSSVGTGYTISDAASLYVANSPAAGCNVTLTRARGITVAAGGIQVGVPGTSGGALYYAGATSGIVTVQAQAAAGTWSLSWPANDGCCGQQLTTNGFGVTSWAAASWERLKEIHGPVCTRSALDTILRTPIYEFHYRPEAAAEGYWTGGGETMVGPLAEEAPWAMQGVKRGAFSPMNAFGTLAAAVQELAEKVSELSELTVASHEERG